MGILTETGAQNDAEQDPKTALYLRQKKLLEDFLSRGAISQAQFDKSFGDLTEKMGMQAYADLS